ncbi:hypothetical protein BDN70DRAFT_840691 [Pholiota conissans]|uniref:Uncharacterized protein n=1 Tax=Pholiota conissans TaxID=109636 RepID=A0A9P5YXF9_9AGAR|nr:hypothetical protein BDN70DRAFT_840691 [Pholiota conissans]
MPSPPITLYMTTIASQPALRQRQEYILRILQVKKIPFTTYDLASDDEAKRLWRRKAPADKQQLPGILVGGKFPGTFAEFEDAVEHDELDIFLRLKEKWDPVTDEDRPTPAVKPVGIPGAATPKEMTPDRLKSKLYPSASASPSPLKGKAIPVNKRTNELDLGDELSGYGLQGVKVTQDELANLIAELGLDGDDAGDLVKGLTDLAISETAIEGSAKKAEADIPVIVELKVKEKEDEISKGKVDALKTVTAISSAIDDKEPMTMATDA